MVATANCNPVRREAARPGLRTRHAGTEAPGAGLKPESITAFFPAYNDAGTIGDLVIAALQTLRQITPDYEVLVVNDGSTDDTARVLAQLAREQPRLRVITHPVNRGYGAALRTGFAAARKAWVFYTDGDGQYDPRELLQLVAALREDVDIVNGYKRLRHDAWHRVVLGRGYHYLATLTFGLRVRDVDCDFRLIRRAALDRVTLTASTGAICVEMVKRFQDAGCRFAEVPVSHYHRLCGTSEFFRWRHLRRLPCALAALWWKLMVKRTVALPVAMPGRAAIRDVSA
jgi:glycosyltransferase involved in cell wall biosynthesis